MSRDRQVTYNREKTQDCRLMILIHSLDEYEKHYGKEKLLALSEHCPTIKNHQRELDEFDKLQFTLWLLSGEILKEKMSAEELSRREIMLAIISESLDNEMKRTFDEERWMRVQLDYLQEIARQMWARINEVEQERLKQKYTDLISSQRHLIGDYISLFTKVKQTLVEKVEAQTVVIAQIRQEGPDKIVALFNGLPKLYEQEPLKNEIVANAKKLHADPNVSLEEFMNYVATAREKIVGCLHQYDYPPATITQFEAGCKAQEKIMKYGIVLEESNRALKQEINAIDATIKWLKQSDEILAREQGNPTYNPQKLNMIIRDCNKHINERSVGLNTIITNEKEHQELVKEVKELNPELVTMGSLADTPDLAKLAIVGTKDSAFNLDIDDEPEMAGNKNLHR